MSLKILQFGKFNPAMLELFNRYNKKNIYDKNKSICALQKKQQLLAKLQISLNSFEFCAFSSR